MLILDRARALDHIIAISQRLPLPRQFARAPLERRTDCGPRGPLAYLHRGERVVAASENAPEARGATQQIRIDTLEPHGAFTPRS